MIEFVLASGSPRRRELLEQLGLTFSVVPADIDESVRPGEDPRVYVRRLSREKAWAVSVGSDAVVIAADTTVDVDGAIIGKPIDGHDARSMLARLSDRTHRVHTGVSVRRGDAVATGVATTEVTFTALSASMIDWYVATGEPLGKAGAYAIQGAGGVLVASVNGSVSNVIGLPTAVLVDLAASIGVLLLAG